MNATQAGARRTRAVLVLVSLAACDAAAGGAAARTMQQKLEKACSTEIARLCPGLKPSDDVKTCLMRRRGEVDPDCMRLIDASE